MNLWSGVPLLLIVYLLLFIIIYNVIFFTFFIKILLTYIVKAKYEFNYRYNLQTLK